MNRYDNMNLDIFSSRATFPTSISGAIIDNSAELFESINDNVLRIYSPHFVNIFCLIPLDSPPVCNNMIILDSWIVDGKYSFVSLSPQNNNYQLAWGCYNSDKDSLSDWRNNSYYDINFPVGGLYWIESRGKNLKVQSFIVDTRNPYPTTPNNFVAKDMGSGRVSFTWQDSSDNETAFHILCERMIGNEWEKLPYIRVNRDSQSINWDAKPGYYRFAIRSAFSTQKEEITFQRKVPSTKNDNGIRNVKMDIPGVIKYSEQTEWKYLLVNGSFSNPISPTNFGGTLKTDSIFFVWQRNSSNETAFHILEDKLINGNWIRQNQIRVPAKRSSWTIPKNSKGKYRYAIRSAYSFPETSIVKTSGITNWIEFEIL